MGAIKLSVYIDQSRRLIIDLPEDTPIGAAELTIQPQEESPKPLLTEREIVRATLLAAGRLVTNIKAPKGLKPLTAEELLENGTLPPDSPSGSEMIMQDRGEC
jgi:hypothetical protein